MYICTYIYTYCIYACLYIYVFILYIHPYIHIYITYIYIHMHICIYTWIEFCKKFIGATTPVTFYLFQCLIVHVFDASSYGCMNVHYYALWNMHHVRICHSRRTRTCIKSRYPANWYWLGSCSQRPHHKSNMTPSAPTSAAPCKSSGMFSESCARGERKCAVDSDNIAMHAYNFQGKYVYEYANHMNIHTVIQPAAWCYSECPAAAWETLAHFFVPRARLLSDRAGYYHVCW